MLAAHLEPEKRASASVKDNNGSEWMEACLNTYAIATEPTIASSKQNVSCICRFLRSIILHHDPKLAHASGARQLNEKHDKADKIGCPSQWLLWGSPGQSKSSRIWREQNLQLASFIAIIEPHNSVASTYSPSPPLNKWHITWYLFVWYLYQGFTVVVTSVTLSLLLVSRCNCTPPALLQLCPDWKPSGVIWLFPPPSPL